MHIVFSSSNTNPLSDVAAVVVVVVVSSRRPAQVARRGRVYDIIVSKKRFKCDSQRCERAGSRNSREPRQPFNPDVLISVLSGENETMRSEAVSSRCVADGSPGVCDDWATG